MVRFKGITKEEKMRDCIGYCKKRLFRKYDNEKSRITWNAWTEKNIVIGVLCYKLIVLLGKRDMVMVFDDFVIAMDNGNIVYSHDFRSEL